MILKVFSVYDSKAEAYMQPFFFNSRGQAVRAFSDTANDPKSQLNRHAGDFTLFEVGEYDDSNGNMLNHKHVNLGKALEFRMELPNASPSLSNESPLL